MNISLLNLIASHMEIEGLEIEFPRKISNT